MGYADGNMKKWTIRIGALLGLATLLTFCGSVTSMADTPVNFVNGKLPYMPIDPSLVNAPGSPMILCVPNSHSTPAISQQIISLAQQQITIEKTSPDPNVAPLKPLIDQYNALIAKSTTCVLTTHP